MIGEQHYEWTIISKAEKSGYWHAQCSCGTEQRVQGAKVRSGQHKGCRSCQGLRSIRSKAGERRGFLVILGEAKMISGARGGKEILHALCACDCGTEVWIRRDHIVPSCSPRKSCGCKRIGSDNYGWKGYKGLSGERFCQIRRGAKSRNLDFQISKEEIWDLFERQNRKCALTGWYLTMGTGETASLDRIDSSKGYTVDNIQWVHKDVNTAKMAMVEEDFIRLCAAVTEHRYG